MTKARSMKLKTATSTARLTFAGLAACLAAALFVGCATTKPVDWNSRVGSYTYQQVVAELGPPDNSTRLADGTIVAEWITRRAWGSAFAVGPGPSGGPGGAPAGQTFGPRERLLRLTFGPDGKLAEGKETTR
jgi:hypothetical protein